SPGRKSFSSTSTGRGASCLCLISPAIPSGRPKVTPLHFTLVRALTAGRMVPAAYISSRQTELVASSSLPHHMTPSHSDGHPMARSWHIRLSAPATIRYTCSCSIPMDLTRARYRIAYPLTRCGRLADRDVSSERLHRSRLLPALSPGRL